MNFNNIISDVLHFKNRILFLWLSIVLLSLAWYPFTGIYFPADVLYTVPVWFGIAAVILALASGTIVPQAELFKLKASSTILILCASIFFLLLIPLPYSIAGIFFIVWILFNSKGKSKLSRILIRISSSAFICGLVLLFQAAIFPLFYLFASRFHSVEFTGPLFNLLIRLAGGASSFSNGHLNIQYADRVYSFFPSLETMGFYPLLNIFIGGCVLIFLFSSGIAGEPIKGGIKKYLSLVILIILYMIFHFIMIVLGFIEAQTVSIFWRFGYLSLILLPIPFILNRFISLTLPEANVIKELEKNKDIHLQRDNKRRIAYIAAISLLIISITGFFGFVDPGVKKEGRILLDEGHSDWEWTVKKLDTKWYGDVSVYNYYSLAQYLNYYYKVDRKREELTSRLLSHYDILIIKTPTNPFSPTEISSIKKFVANGGGLLLIGDHTNVFGITTNLNPLASLFGMKFRYDAQYDLNGELSDFKKPAVLPDPVVQNMPEFMFATSCMLNVPLTAEDAIIGYGIKSIDVDYSRPNFFPRDAGTSENMQYGIFVQAAGMPYGKGRVLLFSDSTVWSNFYMFIPGKPELILGILNWLDRRNGIWEFLHLAFIFIAFGSLILSVFIGKNLNRKYLIYLTIATGLITTPLAVHFFEILNHIDYSNPKQHTKYTQVNFESEHSDFEMPVLHISQNTERDYHTFYVWLQRINAVPKLYSKYEDAIRDTDDVVIINPVKPFSTDEIKKTKDFIENGGKIFLIDDPGKTNLRVSNNFLASLNIPLTLKRNSSSPVTIFRKKNDTLLVGSNSAAEVSGGKQLLYYSAGWLPQNGEKIFAGGNKNDFYSLKNLKLFRNIPPNKSLGNKFHLPQPAQGTLKNKILMLNHENLKQVPGRIPGLMQGRKQVFAGENKKEFKPDSASIVPVMSEYKIGKGEVIVFAASSIFSDTYMGYTPTVPNPEQKRIYDLEFWIFRDVLGLK